MDTIVLKRQLITDASGKPVGVILPLEEYALVEAILEKNFLGGSSRRYGRCGKQRSAFNLRWRIFWYVG